MVCNTFTHSCRDQKHNVVRLLNLFFFFTSESFRFPLWPYMKLLFCCWLVLPIFNGAAYIYETHVRRYFKIGQYVSPNYNERQRKALQMMSLDARKSVERFIESHGPDALDKIIRAVSDSSEFRPAGCCMHLQALECLFHFLNSDAMSGFLCFAG